MTTNPEIAGWTYEYADGLFTALQAYDELGIPVQNLTVALRTDEQTLFCDWVERAEPTYNIWYSAGGNFQSRIGVTAAMMSHRRRRRSRREIVVPHVMRQVTEADCNPDRVNPVVSGTSLVPDEVLAVMFAELMNEGNPGGESATGDLVLELSGVYRQFGAVRALTDVSFDCRPGEVHALVGENGSGKSTLLGIASGFVEPDRGSVRIGGKPLRTDSPALARKLGLAMAYQDTSLIQAEPVKNNLYLAAPPDQRPPFWRRKKWARKLLAEFDLDLELFPDAPAGFLTLAERQLFEVAKALVSNPKVLLLDEPTTALGPDEVEALHRTVVACRRRGVGVVYVSHRLPEVLEIADRITVLRDGKTRGTFDARIDIGVAAGRADRRSSLRGGVSHRVPRIRREPVRSWWSMVLQGQSFGPVSFTLESGEVVGIAGAEGNGQPQLFDCLAGRTPPRAGPCRLRRQGADPDLDPRGGRARGHAAAR